MGEDGFKPGEHPAILPPGSAQPQREGIDDESARISAEVFARVPESAGFWTDDPTGLAIVGIGMNLKRSKREIMDVLARAGYTFNFVGDPSKMLRSFGYQLGRHRNQIRIVTQQTKPALRMSVVRAFDEATESAYQRLRSETRARPAIARKPAPRDLRYERAFTWPQEQRFEFYLPDGRRSAGTLTPEEYLDTYREQRFLWQRKGQSRPAHYPEPEDVQAYLASR